MQRDTRSGVEVLRSPEGRDSIFKTYTNASAKARRLNADEVADAELRAKYAGLPPLPTATLSTLARAAKGAA